MLGRSKLALSAARLLAREVNRANIPAAGRIEPVPARGTAGHPRIGRIVGVAV